MSGSAMRAGAMRTAAVGRGPARRNHDCRMPFSRDVAIDRQRRLQSERTDATHLSWPVISATSSRPSIFGLPPKRCLHLLVVHGARCRPPTTQHHAVRRSASSTSLAIRAGLDAIGFRRGGVDGRRNLSRIQSPRYQAGLLGERRAAKPIQCSCFSGLSGGHQARAIRRGAWDAVNRARARVHPSGWRIALNIVSGGTRFASRNRALRHCLRRHPLDPGRH